MVVADVLSRFNQLVNPEEPGLFSTGTDEHGLKVQKAAMDKGIAPKEFCDSISGSFKTLADTYNCNYTHFIRTSDSKHAQIVSEVWKRLYNSGYIYKAKYEGWYCMSDESFVQNVEEKEVAGQMIKVSPESGHPVEWQSEENYMFKLSEFIEPITKWLASNPGAISPAKFHYYITSMLSHSEAKDLSISRPRNRLTWGIEVPGDPSHTIYVWLDALINYLTITDFPDGEKMCHWPPNVQVIGKDIIKFHAIYWPAFLLALDLPLPQKLLVHSHWTVDAVKMSKSLGNVVNPFEVKDTFTIDGIRYYLMRASSLQDDGNFSRKIMTRALNSELADTLGNLLSRTVAPSVNKLQMYPSLTDNLPPSELELEIRERLKKLPSFCSENYQDGLFNCVADEVMYVLRLGNLFYHRQAPWKLVKDEAKTNELLRTLFVCLEVLRVTSIILSPIVPAICKQVLDKLNVPIPERSWVHACSQFDYEKKAQKLGPGNSIVFTRIK